MASMREFLTTGRLGEVQLGLRPEQVTDLLGNADDRSVRRRPALLLRYGAVEFTFKHIPDTDDFRLVSVAIHFSFPGREVPQTLRPADWMPTHVTTAEQFREFLEQAGIRAESNVQEDQEFVVCSSGASAVFAEGTLHSIHFKRSEKKGERRQMTVSLPEETVEMLRQRAREEHVSVQDLIERMIKASA